MGQGAQSRALRIANQTQYGFDATKIYADNSMSEVVGDVANFDAENGMKNRAGTGKLPQGTPDSFPDAKAPEVSGGITSEPPFNSPQIRTNTARRTSGADPFPGGGWQK